MSRLRRIEKAENEIRILESSFAAGLNEALRRAALGDPGMFGACRGLPERWGMNDTYNRLHELGDEINALRAGIGMPEFDLYARYKAYCRRNGPNDPGEPRLAQEFLKELEAESGSAC